MIENPSDLNKGWGGWVLTPPPFHSKTLMQQSQNKHAIHHLWGWVGGWAASNTSTGSGKHQNKLDHDVYIYIYIIIMYYYYY